MPRYRPRKRLRERKSRESEQGLAELFNIAESDPEWVETVNVVLGKKRSTDYLEGFLHASPVMRGAHEQKPTADYHEGFARATRAVEEARGKTRTQQDEAMDDIIVAAEYARYLLAKDEKADSGK